MALGGHSYIFTIVSSTTSSLYWLVEQLPLFHPLSWSNTHILKPISLFDHEIPLMGVLLYLDVFSVHIYTACVFYR